MFLEIPRSGERSYVGMQPFIINYRHTSLGRQRREPELLPNVATVARRWGRDRSAFNITSFVSKLMFLEIPRSGERSYVGM